MKSTYICTSCHYAGYKTSKYFMTGKSGIVQVLLLCRMVEPGQQETVWSHSSERVCTCPVLTGTAVKVSVQHEGLRAKQEPMHLMGISTHWSFCLTKGSTDSSSCCSEVHGRARERGRCQRVKCWLLPNPQSKTPTGFNGLSCLFLDFKAEADY